jgi:hypothetical protein
MCVIWYLILKLTPMFEWCKVRCEPKNRPCRHVCWKEIGLCQSILTCLDSIINQQNWATYMIILAEVQWHWNVCWGPSSFAICMSYIFLFNCLRSLCFQYVSDIVHHGWLWPLLVERSRVLETSKCYELMKRKIKHEKWHNSLNVKIAQDAALYDWASWLNQIHHKCHYSTSHCHSLSKWGEDANFFEIIPLVIYRNSKWWQLWIIHAKVSYNKHDI